MSNDVEIAVEVRAETDKALLVFDGAREVWIPKSQIRDQCEEDGLLGKKINREIRIPVITNGLTDLQKHVLIHTLTGSSQNGEVYRNYFAACEGHHDMQALTELVASGLMRRGNAYDKDGHYYHCTQAGAEAVSLHLPRKS